MAWTVLYVIVMNPVEKMPRSLFAHLFWMAQQLSLIYNLIALSPSMSHTHTDTLKPRSVLALYGYTFFSVAVVGLSSCSPDFRIGGNYRSEKRQGTHKSMTKYKKCILYQFISFLQAIGCQFCLHLLLLVRSHYQFGRKSALDGSPYYHHKYNVEFIRKYAATICMVCLRVWVYMYFMHACPIWNVLARFPAYARPFAHTQHTQHTHPLHNQIPNLSLMFTAVFVVLVFIHKPVAPAFYWYHGH